MAVVHRTAAALPSVALCLLVLLLLYEAVRGWLDGWRGYPFGAEGPAAGCFFYASAQIYAVGLLISASFVIPVAIFALFAVPKTNKGILIRWMMFAACLLFNRAMSNYGCVG